MKKKVLHISQSILAGVEAYFREIIIYSTGQYDQVLVTPFSQQLDDFCKTKDIKRYTVNMKREVGLFSDISNTISLYKILKRERPDVVHLHSAKAGVLGRLACKLAGCKSVYTPNGVSYLSFTGVKRVLFLWVEVVFKKMTHSLLAVSNSEANRLMFEIGHKAEKVYTVFNSITVNSPLQPRTIDPGKKTIKVGTMARLTVQKNPLLLIDVAYEILKINPDFEFYILGGGHHDHLGDEVNKRIEKYNIKEKVHILSWTGINNTNDFLADLDVFILTSIFEGLPFSLLEAMVAGVPCVVSKCDGCNDVIQNFENGFSCMTATEFASAIINVTSNNDLYKRISENAQAYILSNHNSLVNIPKIHQVYEAVAGESFI